MAYSDFKVGIGVDFLTSNADLQAQLNRYSKNLKVNATVGVDFTKAQVEAKDAAMQIQKILQQHKDWLQDLEELVLTTYLTQPLPPI